jgi:hypothetical protein
MFRPAGVDKAAWLFFSSAYCRVINNQGFVWSFTIVIHSPFPAQNPHFHKTVKQVSIQQLSPNAAILSFNVRVLHGSAGLDKLQADPAAFIAAPLPPICG